MVFHEDMLSEQYVSLTQRVSLRNLALNQVVPASSAPGTANGFALATFVLNGQQAFRIVELTCQVIDPNNAGLISVQGFDVQVLNTSAFFPLVYPCEQLPCAALGGSVGLWIASDKPTPLLFWNDGLGFGSLAGTVSLFAQVDVGTTALVDQAISMILYAIVEIYNVTSNPNAFFPVGKEALGYKP